tara:strand:+ start:32182 stop:33093 length:912 start_codon:yes stop_codon:yes gene_type:complete
MHENYLAKWLANELTAEELEIFQKSDEFASYQKIIKTSEGLKEPSFNMDKALSDSTLKRNTKRTKVIAMHPFKRLMRIAAAVALLFTGTYFYFNSQSNTVETALAENTSLLLPDASEVLLNADSELSYTEKHWETNRDIKLQGEAFFKVAKGQQFTVATANGRVQVLGTQFNVKSRKDFFEVTCYEGLVRVSYDRKTIELPAGTSFLVLYGKVIDSQPTKMLEPSWIRNESTFKSIPLSFVLNELERQYNVTIDAKKIDLSTLFTGSFSHKDLDLALRSICQPTQLNFNLEGNKVLLYAKNAP